VMVVVVKRCSREVASSDRVAAKNSSSRNVQSEPVGYRE
jgi:hypothetical protein